MYIYPNSQTIKYWEEHYFNDFDLFFVTSLPIKYEPILITSKEKFKESSLFNIKTNNLYEIWNLYEYKYVIQAYAGWFESLSNATQNTLIDEQQKINNPLFINNKLITSFKWKTMNPDTKKEFFNTKIHDYQDNKSDEIHIKLPEHIESLVDTFPLYQGSNCLSTVLYVITKSRNILNQWIKGDSFLHTLRQLGYVRTDNSSTVGDVVIYFSDQAVVHAAYQIENNFYLNKNGQTIFNPYKIISKQELEYNWGKYDKYIYRQK